MTATSPYPPLGGFDGEREALGDRGVSRPAREISLHATVFGGELQPRPRTCDPSCCCAATETPR